MGSVPPEIQTGHLLNASLKRNRLNQPARFYAGIIYKLIVTVAFQ
jgi:hypothetical protein